MDTVKGYGVSNIISPTDSDEVLLLKIRASMDMATTHLRRLTHDVERPIVLMVVAEMRIPEEELECPHCGIIPARADGFHYCDRVDWIEDDK